MSGEVCEEFRSRQGITMIVSVWLEIVIHVFFWTIKKCPMSARISKTPSFPRQARCIPMDWKHTQCILRVWSDLAFYRRDVSFFFFSAEDVTDQPAFVFIGIRRQYCIAGFIHRDLCYPHQGIASIIDSSGHWSDGCFELGDRWLTIAILVVIIEIVFAFVIAIRLGGGGCAFFVAKLL